MIHAVWPFLESYGWFLVFGGILAYVAYQKFVHPTVVNLKEQRELVNRKKFDEDVNARVAERMAEARARQQQQHDIVAKEMKAKEEEAKRKKQLEAEKSLQGQSVLNSAVRTAEVKKLIPSNVLSAAQFIDKHITAKPVVMFSKNSCPFCRKAKAILSTFRLKTEEFEYIELDERQEVDGEAVQQEFIQRYGSRSVPKVFIGGKLIGGGDDTVALFHSGELEPMIYEAIANRP